MEYQYSIPFHWNQFKIYFELIAEDFEIYISTLSDNIMKINQSCQYDFIREKRKRISLKENEIWDMSRLFLNIIKSETKKKSKWKWIKWVSLSLNGLF